MNDAPAPSEAALLEHRDGAVVVLTISNPARKNALGMPIRISMMDALDRAEADRSVRAIVLAGAGGTFCSGGDITGMGDRDIATGRDRFRLSHRFVKAMIRSSKPIFAAVEGWAAGAGVSLACCCDTIIAAEDARFQASFPRIGLMADLGLLHTLPARVGWGQARQILLYAETLDARHAERIGLVDHVVPGGTALAAAVARAKRLDHLAPLSIALTKNFLARGLEEALEEERNLQTMLMQSEDHKEGIAAFRAKRAPAFRGS